MDQPFIDLPAEHLAMNTSIDSFSSFLKRIQDDPSFFDLELVADIPFVAQIDYYLFADALRGNDRVISVSLKKINLDDIQCMMLLPALITCSKLKKLNVEGNLLTVIAINAVAYMAESHPSLSELYLRDQKDLAGLDAEKSLANMLSRNIRIILLSYEFHSRAVYEVADRFINRNKELLKSQINDIPSSDYPYPNVRTVGNVPISSRSSHRLSAKVTPMVRILQQSRSSKILSENLSMTRKHGPQNSSRSSNSDYIEAATKTFRRASTYLGLSKSATKEKSKFSQSVDSIHSIWDSKTANEDLYDLYPSQNAAGVRLTPPSRRKSIFQFAVKLFLP